MKKERMKLELDLAKCRAAKMELDRPDAAKFESYIQVLEIG